MKKRCALFLAVAVVTGVLAGCSSNVGTVPPSGSTPTPTPDQSVGGGLKTGFAVLSSVKDSVGAGEKVGVAKATSTAVAVVVDEKGRIVDCVIDAVQSEVQFSHQGEVLTDLATTPQTKNELGDEYGMKKVSSIDKEWYQQAQAFAQYSIGKTIVEMKGMSLSQGVPAQGSELASSVTIHVTDFIAILDKAVTNAQVLGAQPGDKLGLGIVTGIDKSTSAGTQDGLAQIDSTYGVATVDVSGKITSCYLDGSQSGVTFNTMGQITSDISATQPSKNELADAYGMNKVSSIGKEWNQQAAFYAMYVTGRTMEQVKGIALTQGVPTQGSELAASVTIHVTDFNAVLDKATQGAG